MAPKKATNLPNAEQELLFFNQQTTSLKIAQSALKKLEADQQSSSDPKSDDPNIKLEDRTLSPPLIGHSPERHMKFVVNTLKAHDLVPSGILQVQPYQFVQSFKYTNPYWGRGLKGKMSVQTSSNPYGGGNNSVYYLRSGHRWEIMQIIKDMTDLELVSHCPTVKPGSQIPTPETEAAAGFPGSEEKLELMFKVEVNGETKTLRSVTRTYQNWEENGFLINAKMAAAEILQDVLGKTWSSDEIKLNSVKKGPMIDALMLIQAARDGTMIQIEPKGPGGGGGPKGKSKGKSGGSSTASSNSTNNNSRAQGSATAVATNLMASMVYVNDPITIEVMNSELEKWRSSTKTSMTDRMMHGPVQLKVFLSQVLNEADLCLANDPRPDRKVALEGVVDAMKFALSETNMIQVATTNAEDESRQMKVPFTLHTAIRTVFPQGKPPTAAQPREARAYKLIVRSGAAGSLLSDLLNGRDWETAFMEPGSQHPRFQVRHLA